MTCSASPQEGMGSLLDGDADSARRSGRLRRRTMITHLIGALAAFVVTVQVTGPNPGDDVRFSWVVVALVGFFAVAQAVLLGMWWRRTWLAHRRYSLPPDTAVPPPDRWEARHLHEAHIERMLAKLFRVVFIACCWSLELACLAQVVHILRSDGYDQEVLSVTVGTAVIDIFLVGGLGLGVGYLALIDRAGRRLADGIARRFAARTPAISTPAISTPAISTPAASTPAGAVIPGSGGRRGPAEACCSAASC